MVASAAAAFAVATRPPPKPSKCSVQTVKYSPLPVSPLETSNISLTAARRIKLAMKKGDSFFSLFSVTLVVFSFFLSSSLQLLMQQQ